MVVFGHTHNAMIDKDFFLVRDRIYANTGSWCKDNAYCVEIDKNDTPATTCVRLQRVDQRGRIQKTQSEEID